MRSVVSLQIGRVSPLGPEGVQSAFVKHAIQGLMRAEVLGLVGDEQADHSVHGGPDKAVYFYASEHYPRWMVDVPQHAGMLSSGGFGENLTTLGMNEDAVAIGDVLAIGSTMMQVTQPRQPCFKLGLRFNNNALGRIMIQSGRTGWYARVLQPGALSAGDTIQVVRRPSPLWTITRFNRLIRNRGASTQELAELVELEGLTHKWRAEFAETIRGEV